jgi:uncharacterized protein (TIGR03118 family)
MRSHKSLFWFAVPLGLVFLACTGTAFAQYKQKNLVSDKPGVARYTDRNLINGWGLIDLPGSGFVVADAGTGVVTFYGSDGRTLRPPVTVPAAPSIPTGTPGSPAGLVLNTSHEFEISKGGKSAPALLLFATLDGTISGWNPEIDPDEAVIIIDNSTESPFPASYTDLSMTRNKYGRLVLYATDSGASLASSNNVVAMYDGDFHFLGGFTDPAAPSDMTVYSARPVDGKLFVTFAGFVPLDGGVVDVFDTEGKMLRRFAANSPAGPLQAPWAVLRAPADFEWASHALLIGGVDDGHISVFDPQTGAFLGQLKDTTGDPLTIPGLWGLVLVPADPKHEDAKTLYFAAGPAFPPNTAAFSDGLFGMIIPADRNDGGKQEDDSRLISRPHTKSRISHPEH